MQATTPGEEILHPDAEHSARLRELTDGPEGRAGDAPSVEPVSLVSAEIASFLEEDDDTGGLVPVERWRLKRWAELLGVRS